MPPMLSASTVSWCSQPPAGEGSSEGRQRTEPVALENEIALFVFKIVGTFGLWSSYTHIHTSVCLAHMSS